VCFTWRVLISRMRSPRHRHFVSNCGEPGRVNNASTGVFCMAWVRPQAIQFEIGPSPLGAPWNSVDSGTAWAPKLALDEPAQAGNGGEETPGKVRFVPPVVTSRNKVRVGCAPSWGMWGQHTEWPDRWVAGAVGLFFDRALDGAVEDRPDSMSAKLFVPIRAQGARWSFSQKVERWW